MRSVLLTVGTAVLLGAGAAASPAADTTIASDLGDVAISAYGGYSAWSVKVPGGYALTVRAPDGGVSRPKVATRPKPFDVDLGPGPRGAPTAVYTRCHPLCHIAALNLRSGVEKRLTKLDGSAAQEYEPAIWNTNVAFVRRYKADHYNRESLYIGRSNGSAKAARQQAPPSPRFDSVDLKGSTVAFTFAADAGTGDDSTVFGLWVDRSGKRPLVISDAVAGPSTTGYFTPASPSLDGRRVVFLELGAYGGSPEDNAVVSRSLTTGATTRKTVTPTPMAVAQDGKRRYLLQTKTDPIDCPCTLTTSG